MKKLLFIALLLAGRVYAAYPATAISVLFDDVVSGVDRVNASNVWTNSGVTFGTFPVPPVGNCVAQFTSAENDAFTAPLAINTACSTQSVFFAECNIYFDTFNSNGNVAFYWNSDVTQDNVIRGLTAGAHEARKIFRNVLTDSAVGGVFNTGGWYYFAIGINGATCRVWAGLASSNYSSATYMTPVVSVADTNDTSAVTNFTLGNIVAASTSANLNGKLNGVYVGTAIPSALPVLRGGGNTVRAMKLRKQMRMGLH